MDHHLTELRKKKGAFLWNTVHTARRFTNIRTSLHKWKSCCLYHLDL